MTDFTIAQLGAILSVLAGEQGNPSTKASAMRAIVRHAAAVGRSREAVLAFAPKLLESELDPALWREQLTAPAEDACAGKDGQLADGGGRSPPASACGPAPSKRWSRGCSGGTRAPRWTS